MRQLLFAGLLTFFITGCGVFNKSLKMEVIQTEYQAFFISLDERKITPIQKVLKNDKIVADFWMEIGDPEIGTLGNEFEGLPHKGQPTQVVVYNKKPYSGIDKIPAKIKWKDYIASENIQEGLVFLVKSSSNKFYKVELKEMGEEKVKLRFKHLK